MRMALAGSLVVLAACHGASDAAVAGPMVTRQFPVSGAASGLDVRGSDDVHVMRGPRLAVSATGPKEVLDHLRIFVRDGTLIVSREPGEYRSMRGAKVSVTMPSLAGVAIEGSSDVAVDRVDGARFAAALNGSGNLRVAALDVGNASVNLSGSGDVSAAGHAGSLALSTGGSGDIDLTDVTSDRATLSTHGSGNIAIGETRSATGATSGSGDITVAGHPSCTIAKSGSGDVRCG